jgi:hypothetical protein
MRKTMFIACVKVVKSLFVACVSRRSFCPVFAQAKSLNPQLSYEYTGKATALTPRFSTLLSGFLHLLVVLLSTVSTPPITKTTIYIN